MTELPAYSVLVPLFRETAVLNQLVGALARLRYPAEKLDIKLILEEEDMGMQARGGRSSRCRRSSRSSWCRRGGRRPSRARLNYALPFCRGELLTIYDAEDIPEPDQLREGGAALCAGGPELACLQAQLTFFNPNENWLARQFTAEYAMLFGRLLPVLADHRLPLPLGGTSNHFRTAVLARGGRLGPLQRDGGCRPRPPPRPPWL